MFLYRRNPNDPRTDINRGEDKRVLDDRTGKPGIDGFTRLSQADRETGHRPRVGGHNETFGRHVIE